MKINQRNSTPFLASSGVPQRYQLGPLLFILFTNDVADGVQHLSILIFADDIKLYTRVETVKAQECLQEDLNKISQWSVENRLELNCHKCKLLSFSRNSSKGCVHD